MIEECINCGKPISGYPCKFCGAGLMIDDVCPRLRGALCMKTKKVCLYPRDYINCEILRKEN